MPATSGCGPSRKRASGPLAERLPAGVDFDSALPAYVGVDASVARGIALHQTYWRALGGWRPESWDLLFAVLAGGEVVGVQSLDGRDFARRRTLETWSILLPAARGRGLGKEMRRAVLALAFDHLGALAGEIEDGVDLMLRMRLTRERWRASGGAPDVAVTGVEACRYLFGR